MDKESNLERKTVKVQKVKNMNSMKIKKLTMRSNF